MRSGANLLSVAAFVQRHLETRRLGKYPRLMLRRKMERPLCLAMACGAVVRRGGFVPHYNLETDEIHLPPARWYRALIVVRTPARFANDALHELVHWASAPRRLNRLHSREWGDREYARAELEAELGAAILAKELQLSRATILPHASYLDSWLRGIGNAELELSAALAAANRATGYLLSKARDELV